MLTLKRRELDRRIDEAVEQFEQAVAGGQPADVRDFMPPIRSQDDRCIATELLCVDINYRWQRGERKRVREYQQQFRNLLLDSRALAELAREEFRLRRQAGERIDPEDYRSEFGIDTSNWPIRSTDDLDTITGQMSEDTGIDSLGAELQRLPEAITELPAAGERFGEFQLVEELGHGAFSVVYLAQQSTLEDRPVVLKITAVSPVEAAFLSKLQHTNIVPIYSLHKDLGLQAICMPFFGRYTLAHRLSAGAESSPSIDAARAVEIALQIAHGLVHAHERGIVHRDLKPANVLLADDGTAMILDFNLSDDVIAGGKSSLMVGGTLPYLAPEHLAAIRAGHRVDKQADIYSLGAILFQMLCRELPFPPRRASFDVTVAQMITDRQVVPSARSRNPRVTPGLDAIVRKMLDPRPTARYQSMEEVVDDLDRHLHDLPLRLAPDVSLGERVTKWSRRHPRISSATSVLLASAVLLVLLMTVLLSLGQRMARQEAIAAYSEFRQQLPQVRVLTSTLSGGDQQTLQGGVALAQQLVGTYDVLDSTDWRHNPAYVHLDADHQRELEGSLVQTLYALASANVMLAEDATEASQRDDRLKLALRANRSAQAIGPTTTALRMLNAQNERIQRMMSSESVGANTSQPKVRLPESDNQPSYLTANSLLENGQCEDAIRALEQIRLQDPYDIAVWFMLGQAYGSLGRFSDAEACFSICIAMWPDSYLGYFHRGRCRLETEQYDAGAADFSESLARKADYVPARINRAICLRELGQFETAELDLTQAIECQASQTRVYFLRSEIRQHLGDAVGAAADREMGLRLTPRDELSWIARGLAQLRQDPRGALHDFQMATALNPKSYAAWRNIAHIYAERLHQPQDAISVLNQLQHDSPLPLSEIVSRGVLSARLGKREEALQDAQDVLSHSPNAKELFQVACIYSLTSLPDNNDAEIALGLLEKAIVLEPQWLPIAMKDPDLNKLRLHAEFRPTLERHREPLSREQMTTTKPE